VTANSREQAVWKQQTAGSQRQNRKITSSLGSRSVGVKPRVQRSETLGTVQTNVVEPARAADWLCRSLRKLVLDQGHGLSLTTGARPGLWLAVTSPPTTCRFRPEISLYRTPRFVPQGRGARATPGASRRASQRLVEGRTRRRRLPDHVRDAIKTGAWLPTPALHLQARGRVPSRWLLPRRLSQATNPGCPESCPWASSLTSGQWSVVSGQWPVVSGQWSVTSGQATLGLRSSLQCL